MRAGSIFYLTACLCISASAAGIPKPSTFGRAELVEASEGVSEAWTRWDSASRNFEREAMALPRSEGQAKVRHAYAALTAYIGARRIYAEAVSSSLDAHAHPSAAITVEAVSADELDLLGAQLSDVQKRLESLRNLPEWITMRRGIQKERDAISKLQDSRRERIPDSLLSTRAEVSRPITSALYKQSDDEVRTAIQSLWTKYCQTLLNIVYQQPEGSTSADVQLQAVESANNEPEGAESQSRTDSRLTGAWTYIESSHRFEGAAEPKHVVLELWVDSGQLVGRYRAELQDKGGVHHLDLRLAGKPSGRRNQTFAFKTADSGVTGTLTIQPSPNGMDLTLIRPAGTAVVPGGKEVLTRR